MVGVNWLNIAVFIGAIILIVKNAIELKREGSNETRTKALKFSNIMLIAGTILYIITFIVRHV